MLLFLIEFLSSVYGMKVPAVFTYSSTRMMLAMVTTLMCTVLLGPRFIRKLYELKTGQSIRVEDCPVLAQIHEKKKETPTMGGILILSSMLIALFIWMDLRSIYTLLLFVTTVWLGLVGGYDDYLKLKYKNSKGMPAKRKFFFQVLLASIVGVYLLWPAAMQMVQQGKWFAAPVVKEQIVQKESVKTVSLSPQEAMGRYYFPFFKEPLFSLKGWALLIGFFFILFILIGTSNAVNLTDGLDGLAAGTLVMVSLVLAVVAFLSNNIEISRYLNILYIEGSGEIGIYLCALAGACLGFLWYNGHPAQVFMGDTGSLALGGVIGLAAILLRREFLLAIVGGVFVIEALSVIIQVASFRFRDKKRVFLCAPIHHHFEYKGWPETKVVVRFWMIGLVLAMIGMISLKFQ